MTQATTPNPRAPIQDARDMTERVQQDLQVAGAELGLANDALERHLPADIIEGDIAWAMGQNAAVEQKLEEAVEELAVVTELLEEEQEERKQLERALRGH